ncbi:MAG TPA: DUF5056 domain-containing protein [Chthoniobacterales bacterium]|nr:DUF5056 domain-containing protein [Chthoniobacterales bacterium]
MDGQLQEDWLDAKLRDELPYIDDDGFTSRVSQQLPVRRGSSKARAAILLSFTVIAAVLAYVVAGGGSFVMDVVGWFAVKPLAALYLITIACGLLVTGLAVFFALSRSRKLRS